MKLIGLTMRDVPALDGRQRMDAIERGWLPFLRHAGCAPLLLPSDETVAVALAEQAAPAGLIFTGGEDLVACGGTNHARDAAESALYAWARKRGVPVLGVCRGAQFLAMANGATLERVAGHAGTPHAIDGALGGRVVNSFHRWGVSPSPDTGLEPLAMAGETIEAFRCRGEATIGIMWHPERVAIPDPADLALFRSLFGE